MCDPPKACKVGSYRALPPLDAGETIVQSFEMPDANSQVVSALPEATLGGPPPGASFAQRVAPAFTMLVPITKVVAVAGSSELLMNRSSVMLPVEIERSSLR